MMRIFPANHYSLITHLTPDEIENVLLKKSADHRTFVVSGMLRLKTGIVFNTTFFTSYRSHFTYRAEPDDSAPPAITVEATKKENHTLLNVTTELGHSQQSIFVIFLGLSIFIWLIVLGGVIMMKSDFHQLIIPSIFIGIILLLGIPIMHLYVNMRNDQSRQFFMEHLKARRFD